MASLVILAAGLGSRFGGLKQLSTFGPYQHHIIDYTIFDAIKSGFNKVVCVIRKEFERDFRDNILNTWSDKIEIELVYQELESIPKSYKHIENRTKPWGTAHALWMAEDAISEPFAMVNADDFYGRDALQSAFSQLQLLAHQKQDAFIIAYKLGNTLSPSGAVSRGFCHLDSSQIFLTSIEELKLTEDSNERIVSHTDALTRYQKDDLVSMNLIGFSPAIFDTISSCFERFYRTLTLHSDAEFYITDIINELLKSNRLIRVIPTDSEWFGVTYSDDKYWVNYNLEKLHHAGEYPDDF